MLGPAAWNNIMRYYDLFVISTHAIAIVIQALVYTQARRTACTRFRAWLS